MTNFVKLKDLGENASLRYTNDLKLTAALISRGQDLVAYEERKNPRNGRPEIWFGFEVSEMLRETEIMFLSKRCMVDAATVQDNRDMLLSFVSNRNREILENLKRS